MSFDDCAPLSAAVFGHFRQKFSRTESCWVSRITSALLVRLYGREGFRGDRLTLLGPINMPAMIGPFGTDWENEVRSLQTDPKANVTVFDNRYFFDQSKFIGPNESVQEMSEKMGFLEDFRSMMLSCI